jgi:hypothetical protein
LFFMVTSWYFIFHCSLSSVFFSLTFHPLHHISPYCYFIFVLHFFLFSSLSLLFCSS